MILQWWRREWICCVRFLHWAGGGRCMQRIWESVIKCWTGKSELRLPCAKYFQKNINNLKTKVRVSVLKKWSWKSPGNKKRHPVNIYLKHMKAGELRIAVWLIVITLKHDLKGETLDIWMYRYDKKGPISSFFSDIDMIALPNEWKYSTFELFPMPSLIWYFSYYLSRRASPIH